MSCLIFCWCSPSQILYVCLFVTSGFVPFFSLVLFRHYFLIWFCPHTHNHIFSIFNKQYSKILSGSSWKQLKQGQYQNTDGERAKSDLMDFKSYNWFGVNSMITSGSVSPWHGQPCGLQLFKGEWAILISLLEILPMYCKVVIDTIALGYPCENHLWWRL